MGYSWKLPVILYIRPSGKDSFANIRCFSPAVLRFSAGSIVVSRPRRRTSSVRQLIMGYSAAIRSFFPAISFICHKIGIAAPARETSTCPAVMYETVEGNKKQGKPSVVDEGSSQKPRSFKSPSKKDINEALHHCLQMTRKRDYTNYVAGLLMPPEIQPALFALLAFNVELAVIRDQIIRNSGVSGIYRLQFWNDTLDILYGRARGPLPRQPVATALSLFGHHFDEKLLRNLIAARQKTLGDRPFTSVDDVKKYGTETTGSLIQLLMRLLSPNFHGPSDCDVSLPKEACAAAESMSKAVAIVTLIRSVMPLIARGIFLLPDDLTGKYHVNVDDVYGNKKQDALRALIMELTNIAEAELLESRCYRESIDRNLRLALMASGATLDHLLTALRKSNSNLLDTRLQRGYELLAWRLWWRKLRGQY